MKTLMTLAAAAFLFVSVPAFACGGHGDGAKAENSCGACGTDACSCKKDKKDGQSCSACGTEACTCGHAKEEGQKKS